MEVMIHAVPERMWYVEEFLVPSLHNQGIKTVAIWNDAEHRGNLISCMEAFASCEGDGATWHIQDDVLISHDFRERAEGLEGVVYGFACEYFCDDVDITGEVYAEDAWHSFQCVRIPNEYARECAEWFFSRKWETESYNVELPALEATNRGDDGFFREFLLCRHGTETVTNLKPNIVEHVDLWLGGSVLHKYRDYLAVAHYWEDAYLTEQLKDALRERKLGSWAV